MFQRRSFQSLSWHGLLLTAALLGAARAQQAAPTSPEPAPAQTDPVQTAATTPALPVATFGQLFGALQNYPSLVQARLAVQAAQTQQDSTAFPVSASASGNLIDLANVDPTPAVCATSPLALLTSPCAPIGGVTSTLNLTVRATPLPVGDTAARQQQAALATEQARLGYASALSALEAQAVLAAERVQLSQIALTLAGQAQVAAQLALQTAQNRVAGGGATDIDLAQAQLVLGQAQSGAAQAQDNLTVARAALQDLIGSGNAPSLPAVTPPASGTPASVQQARFGVRRAQIVQAQVSWDALPNVQASYTHSISDTAGVGVSVDSHNLSPAVNFSYAPRMPPLNRVRDQFSLGVNFDASASSFSAPGLAQNALDQAQAGLETARRQAELQLAGLNAAYAQAQRQRTLAQQALSLAQQQQQNAAARQDLGLSAPLDVAQASAAAYQAQVALGQAQLNETDAALKFYAFFALPLDGAARP
ncbi:TolC family protein [Deinococcus alpinitundrae]|uniref:TolC family protein n=1 Tax=Deinococcus alpinitundrae TaxID=468913 RepID=UPI00137B124B|nr:TolC family protein [Deinococcus alpinitundrae]